MGSIMATAQRAVTLDTTNERALRDDSFLKELFAPPENSPHVRAEQSFGAG